MNSDNNETSLIHDSILKVFLSHASEDRPSVIDLFNKLRQNGVDAWIDKEKLHPGEDFDLEIKDAIKKSDAVIICLSKRSITKEGYIQKEIKYVLDTAQEKPPKTIFIIPLMLENLEGTEIRDELRKLKWIDYSNAKQIDFEKLMNALKKRAEQCGKIISPHPLNFESGEDELRNFLKNNPQYDHLKQKIFELYEDLKQNNYIVQAKNPETLDDVISFQHDYRHIYKVLILADEKSISLIQRFLKDAN